MELLLIFKIIIGLGIASMFRQICQGKDCYKFIGPKHSEIRNQKLISAS